MEHILQIGINVDDEAIKQAAINECAKQIMNDIKSSVQGRYYGNYQDKLKSIVEEGIDKFCEEHKDIIIQGAINQLADKLSKTKVVREKVKELVNDDGC